MDELTRSVVQVPPGTVLEGAARSSAYSASVRPTLPETSPGGRDELAGRVALQLSSDLQCTAYLLSIGTLPVRNDQSHRTD